tara:strand:+ start:3746 stop:4543 length:798 start_codon:yes stop_codon:yes gene_type:complete
MTEKQSIKSIKYLTVYSVISSILLLFLLFKDFSFKQNIFNSETTQVTIDSLKVRFISAERVDIVESDGKLGISLSNSDFSPLPRFDGKILSGANDRKSPNIVFFDGKGDEVGGINFFNDAENENAIRHLAFDGFKQDEVVTLSHFVKNGKSNTGLYIYDRPDINIIKALDEMGILPADNSKALNAKVKDFKNKYPERYKEIWDSQRRVAVQTNDAEQSEIVLADGNGNSRLRLSVSKSGTASIEFLDKNGLVINSINSNKTQLPK